MKRPILYPYKMKSSSAKKLSEALGVKRVRLFGKFRNNFNRPVVNWGNSKRAWWMDRWPNQVILNTPESVAISRNKRLTFEKFAENQVPCPEWTTSKEEAFEWDTVVCRTILTGKGGRGIIIWNKDSGEELPDAPLYTKYFKKKREFRVHVFNGEVIDFAEKKKRREAQNVNYKIRNHGDWVFCREGVELPECCAQAAIQAVKAVGLTFGACDVGYNEMKNLPCVFEVNSAPGIEGTTVLKYKEAIEKFLQQQEEGE